jgi:hypothetical protein
MRHQIACSPRLHPKLDGLLGEHQLGLVAAANVADACARAVGAPCWSPCRRRTRAVGLARLRLVRVDVRHEVSPRTPRTRGPSRCAPQQCRRLLCDPYRFVEPHQERRAGGRSLCGSCKHAHLYRRRDKLDPAVYCHELSRYVPPVIVVQSVPGRGGAESAADAGDRPADRSAARGHRRQLSLRLGRGTGRADAVVCYPYHR